MFWRDEDGLLKPSRFGHQELLLQGTVSFAPNSLTTAQQLWLTDADESQTRFMMSPAPRSGTCWSQGTSSLVVSRLTTFLEANAPNFSPLPWRMRSRRLGSAKPAQAWPSRERGRRVPAAGRFLEDKRRDDEIVENRLYSEVVVSPKGAS